MSISFEDSLKKVQEESAQAATASVASFTLLNTEEEDNIATLAVEDESIAAYSGDSWLLDNKYLYYPEYNDDSVSSIDKNKNIVLDSNQINITQETNSQFIPFEMPRFYDGFDLTKTNILIHFVNSKNYEDYDSPINVYYNDDKIKFGWLVDERVTIIKGIVKFEIQAIGVNSQGEEYIWRTKPCNGLNVLQSLTGNGIIEPDNTWLTSFLSQVTTQVSLAKQYAEEAKAAVESGGTVAIALDKTLTTEGQAADAKAVGDTIASLPIVLSADGYSELTNQRKIKHIESIKTDDSVQVIVTLQGNKKVVLDVGFNANNYPTSLTINGHTATFSWSGF